jgi:hypothetical protein
MKKILIFALIMLTSTAYAKCPSTLSGTYSGFIQSDISQYKNIIAKFGTKNTINVVYSYGTTYDNSGNAFVQQLNYPQFNYSYDKSLCVLRAWPVGYNSSQYDLFLSVSNSGNVIEGFQIDNAETYKINFTKQ